MLGFRHGPKTIINDRTLVVVALSNERYARAYDRDLLAELRRDGRAGTVLALTARATTSPQASVCCSRAWNDASDTMLVLLGACLPQIYALRQSSLLGLTPDRPNAAGVVNRVVQGVTIHRWQPSRAAMYLGVDGGGTKTAYALIDADGRLRATHLTGSVSHLADGFDARERHAARRIGDRPRARRHHGGGAALCVLRAAGLRRGQHDDRTDGRDALAAARRARSTAAATT